LVATPQAIPTGVTFVVNTASDEPLKDLSQKEPHSEESFVAPAILPSSGTTGGTKTAVRARTGGAQRQPARDG